MYYVIETNYVGPDHHHYTDSRVDADTIEIRKEHAHNNVSEDTEDWAFEINALNERITQQSDTIKNQAETIVWLWKLVDEKNNVIQELYSVNNNDNNGNMQE